eukprot:4003420-Alexandrium_andersonii.AAC.1
MPQRQLPYPANARATCRRYQLAPADHRALGRPCVFRTPGWPCISAQSASRGTGPHETSRVGHACRRCPCSLFECHSVAHAKQ